MNNEQANKILEFFKQGGKVMYYLENDDFVGWIPVSIKRENEINSIIYISDFDIRGSDVYECLEECKFEDFKFFKEIHL